MISREEDTAAEAASPHTLARADFTRIVTSVTRLLHCSMCVGGHGCESGLIWRIVSKFGILAVSMR